MSKDVFISYSSKDANEAQQICGFIEERGVTCWIASRDITPGKPYAEEIINAIESTSAMLLVLSEHANTSVHVMNEVDRAQHNKKLIIPVRIQNVQPSKGLELYISRPHWVDAWIPPLEQRMDQLAAAIRALSKNSPPQPLISYPSNEPGIMNIKIIAATLGLTLVIILIVLSQLPGLWSSSENTTGGATSPKPEPSLTGMNNSQGSRTPAEELPPKLTLKWKDFMEVKSGAPCPGFYVMPGYIVPKHGSVEIQDKIYREDYDNWQAMPNQNGVYENSLDISSIIKDKSWVKLSNSILITVIVQEKIPEHVNVVNAGECGEGGEIRKFPVTDLNSNSETYQVRKVFSGNPFFKLQPGEFESFQLDLMCRGLGAFRLKYEVSFSISSQQGLLSYADSKEIVCPKSFTLWDAHSGESLKFVGDYTWNGTRYIKTQ